MVNATDGRFRRAVIPGLAIVAEWADGVGQRMVTRWIDQDAVVSPGGVAEVIRRALARGWSPRERGAQVVLPFAQLRRVPVVIPCQWSGRTPVRRS